MQEWSRYEATKYAFLDFIGMKPAPTGAGGGIVKIGEIVLKHDMGYVDKLIGWIGRHPYLSALGLIGLFAGGVAYASSDTVKKTVDKNYEKGSKFVKEKYASLGAAPAVVVPAVNKSAVPTATPYQFKPGIEIFGSDEYKQKIQSALDEIKRINITEYNEVMLYIDSLYQNPLKAGESYGKGGDYLPENELIPSNIIHIKEHIKQTLEPLRIYYENKSGWYMELDAVKKQVDWEAEAYNYTDERKLQQIKNYMGSYKNMYSEQYAKWISES